MARGEWTDPRLGKTTFGEWAARVEESRVDRRPSTRARDESVMRSLVLPTFGSRSLGEIHPIDVRGGGFDVGDHIEVDANLRRELSRPGSLENDVDERAGGIHHSPLRSATYAWTIRIEIEPSPTAEATRLMEP